VRRAGLSGVMTMTARGAHPSTMTLRHWSIAMAPRLLCFAFRTAIHRKRKQLRCGHVATTSQQHLSSTCGHPNAEVVYYVLPTLAAWEYNPVVPSSTTDHLPPVMPRTHVTPVHSRTQPPTLVWVTWVTEAQCWRRCRLGMWIAVLARTTRVVQASASGQALTRLATWQQLDTQHNGQHTSQKDPSCQDLAWMNAEVVWHRTPSWSFHSRGS